jgi:hypothetical protein
MMPIPRKAILVVPGAAVGTAAEAATAWRWRRLCLLLLLLRLASRAMRVGNEMHRRCDMDCNCCGRAAAWPLYERADSGWLMARTAAI